MKTSLYIFILSSFLFACTKEDLQWDLKKTTRNAEFSPDILTKNITNTYCEINAFISWNAGTDILEKGICYSLNENPTIDNAHTSDLNLNDSIICYISNLSPNTIYFLRAYSKNIKNISYSNQIKFKTTNVSCVNSTIKTTEATNITNKSANIGGILTNSGQGLILENGFCYSKSINPSIENSTIKSQNYLGLFESNLINLESNTIYYVKAYSINQNGIAYGQQISFKTL